MQTGLTRAFQGALLFALAVGAGCACTQGQVEHALVSDHNPIAHARDLENHYLVRCPDVLAIDVVGCVTSPVRRKVGLDGRIALTERTSLLVDGLPTPRIAQEVASLLGVPAEEVHVQVAEHQSQHLYLFGEIGASNPVVTYRGPETIVDLLQRIGTSADAALGDIQVVRAHVADGTPPEVFHVDLAAIVLKRDMHTNIRLEPFDRIHVGQNRRSKVTCHLPPWMRRMCESKKGS